MASSETLYQRFYPVSDDEREDDEERERYTRYHDAFFAVDEAYRLLKNAAKFNCYDSEEESRLNDLRKRLFYFQRKSQETLYALRDDEPGYKQRKEFINTEIKNKKDELEKNSDKN